MVFRTLLFALACVLVCGTVQGATTFVEIKNQTFSPTQVTVFVGDTVKWTNNDTVTHNITSGIDGIKDLIISSGELVPGATYEFTFNTAGSYFYYCTTHTGMTGSVLVSTSATNLTCSLIPNRRMAGTGDLLTLSAEAASKSPIACDVYLIAEAPNGQTFCMNANLQFIATSNYTPFVAGWVSANLPVTQFWSAVVSGLPLGNYTLRMIVTKQGAGLADTSRWQAHSEIVITII